MACSSVLSAELSGIKHSRSEKVDLSVWYWALWPWPEARNVQHLCRETEVPLLSTPQSDSELPFANQIKSHCFTGVVATGTQISHNSSSFLSVIIMGEDIKDL